MNSVLVCLVFFPMLCGPVSYLIGRRSKKMRDYFVMLVTLMELLATVAVVMGKQVSLRWNGFCGLGIGFESGGFHSLMALLAASGWFAASILSLEYFSHVKRRNRYYMFWLLTLGATMGVFLSADLYTTFIFFEIMSFTSYVFVVQTEEQDAVRASGTYLAVAVIGGLVTLYGLFLLYNLLGTLQISELAHAAEHVTNRGDLWLAGLLTLVGFGAKAGAFPLHIWLPTAHPAAPAPASAVLSGVITKTGIYGVAILSTTLFLHDAAWGSMLAVIGAITMVLGAALAVCSVDLKRTLACSSVSQIGFIMVGLAMQCLLGHHNALAVDGTILHVLNHSLIKMVLFPIAGIIHLSTHSYDLNDIQGFGRGKPLLAVLTGIPMLSLAGLPLLNGYVSKTLLHESIVEYIVMLEEGTWIFTALEWPFLFAGGLTFAYMLKLFICIFVEKNAKEKKFHGHGKYIATPSAVVLGCYVVLMCCLGGLPNKTMDGIAAFARHFFHGEAPHHAVHYFSLVNLKGAAISLTIGALVYLLIVCLLLKRNDTAGIRQYIDPIPSWCNIEYGIYRPLLTVLAQTLMMFAILVDKIGPWIFTSIPRVFACVYRWAQGRWGGVVQLVTGDEYHPRPTLEQTVDDPHFGHYADHPQAEKGILNSFAFGLMLTGLGLAFAILFIFLHR